MMTASKVTINGGEGRRGRGGGERREHGLNHNDNKLKQPSAELMRLLTDYLYVPLSIVEDVVDPMLLEKPIELVFGGMAMEEEQEEKGGLDQQELEHGRCMDNDTLAYYEQPPCKQQKQYTGEAGAAPRPSHGYGRGSNGRQGRGSFCMKVTYKKETVELVTKGMDKGEVDITIYASGLSKLWHNAKKGRMPGLARDVLRWLVALNLSFPIKNIKRDFSNGFMVAEIFSRYFPLDVYMHSYDYGSRAASKKDNWEQLNKFFKKKGFVVHGHEIDNIIHCRTIEGAGPLLQRMYNFLTQKRYKPEDDVDEQPSKHQNDTYEQWNAEAPLEVPTNHSKQDIDQFSCSASDTSSWNQGDYEEDCHSRQQDAMYGEDMYHGALQLDPRYESGCLLKMDDEDCVFDFATTPHNTTRYALQGYEPRQRSVSPSQFARNKGSNAIQKARQREVKKVVDRAKAGLRGEVLRFEELARKAKVEAGLAFRSPHRERAYKQYTLPDYRQQKQFGYVELGRLGPGDPTPELVGKREKLAQRKEFGRHARSCNIMSHTNPTLVDYSRTIKTDAASSRKKALAFASKIPKPKLKIPSKDAQENLLPLQNPHAMSDLQILEAKHQSDKLHIEAIRRDLEQFLR